MLQYRKQAAARDGEDKRVRVRVRVRERCFGPWGSEGQIWKYIGTKIKQNKTKAQVVNKNPHVGLRALFGFNDLCIWA